MSACERRVASSTCPRPEYPRRAYLWGVRSFDNVVLLQLSHDAAEGRIVLQYQVSMPSKSAVFQQQMTYCFFRQFVPSQMPAEASHGGLQSRDTCVGLSLQSSSLNGHCMFNFASTHGAFVAAFCNPQSAGCTHDSMLAWLEDDCRGRLHADDTHPIILLVCKLLCLCSSSMLSRPDAPCLQLWLSARYSWLRWRTHWHAGRVGEALFGSTVAYTAAGVAASELHSMRARAASGL